MGQPEPAPSLRGAGQAGLHRRSEAGRPAAEAPQLQPASQPQDARRCQPPRPQRSVRAYQHQGKSIPGRRAAGDLCRHEEKELVGDFKNGCRELRPKGQPEPVRVHDFAIPELGKAVPYGIYDVSANAGFVNVGISADTGEFSVASIRRWWREIGAPRYPEAKQMLINADCGGSNGARLRLWKRELQVLADELGHRDHRLSCPARHQQVEQNRASAVFLHHSELARQATDSRWLPSTSNPPISTANGTIPSPRNGRTDDAIFQAQTL